MKTTMCRLAIALALAAGLVMLLADPTRTDAQSSAVTFNKDVLPVLQKNCQNCHRPGQIAPMSLLTYKEARPWAKAIKNAYHVHSTTPFTGTSYAGAGNRGN